jgi:hypothetical protein
MSFPDYATRLDKEICRTEEFFCSSFEADCPSWAKVLFVEDIHKYLKDGTYRVPRSALPNALLLALPGKPSGSAELFV